MLPIHTKWDYDRQELLVYTDYGKLQFPCDPLDRFDVKAHYKAIKQFLAQYKWEKVEFKRLRGVFLNNHGDMVFISESA